MASASPQLEDGYLMIANELLEAILGFGFSLREQSVLFTVIRKTYGYRKKEDDMSASQIGAMCAVSRQHVTTTLNLLALRNVISKRPGRYGSIIGIQKDHRKWITAERMKSIGSPIVQDKDICPDLGLVLNTDTPCPDLGQFGSPDLGHTKDNLTKDNYQNTKSCAPQAESDIVGDLPAGKKQRRAMTGTKELQNRFDRFYAAYPKKKSRAAAEKAFAKLGPSDELVDAMIHGIEKAIKSGQWSDPQFIPHPSTWLNAAGWEDEIQVEYSAIELSVIKTFNKYLSDKHGEVPEDPFVEKRAAAIRDFMKFQNKENLAERFFKWLVDEQINLPPFVGFDWIISREGFTKACAAQR